MEGISRHDQESSVVRRAAAIAVENIKQHIGNARPKYEETKAWADQINDDQYFLLGNWQKTLDGIASIPARKELGHCIRDGHTDMKESHSTGTSDTNTLLQDFLEVEEVKRAGASGEEAFQRFQKRVDDLNNSFEDAVGESGIIVEDFQHVAWLQDSEIQDQASRLLEEIEVLAGKINSDYEHLLGLPESPKSLLHASKTAQVHKSNFVPSLVQTYEEIVELMERIIKKKNSLMKSSVRFLQQISAVESKVSQLHTKLAALDLEEEIAQAFDLLNLVVKLPSIYGSLLVECVRRREWTEKMTADSSSLVEEMATYKEDEVKRRQKWAKDMDGAVDLSSLDDMALGIEVNLQAQKQKWPNVSRDEINEYTRRLSEAGGMDEALREIHEQIKALNTPFKHSARGAKAFKNGSVHEAAYGKTSMLLRGDDDVVSSMRNEKVKAEEKLKSAESRIRKLEDLLHRQSQLPRPTSAGDFGASNTPSFERHATSPIPNFTSALSKARDAVPHRSPASSRGVSINGDPEEKALAQRIVSLEAELTAQRAQSRDLERNAAARTNAEDNLKSQIGEATSTKEDLLGNLEAQQREFDDERRLLEDENSKLKLRLEEVEDEFDRVLESHEHDEKVQALEEELERVKSDAANKLERLHDETESLRGDYALQQEKVSNLEDENLQHTNRYTDLNSKADDLLNAMQQNENAQVDHHRALRSTLLHLLPESTAPRDFSALVEAVELAAEKSAASLKQALDTVETLQADNAALEKRLKSQGDEIYDLREHLGCEERGAFSLREELSKLGKAHAASTAQVVALGSDYKELQNKLQEGETDSLGLAQELKGRDNIIDGLRNDITRKGYHVESLETKIASIQQDLQSAKTDHERSASTHNDQATRATDVATRLHIQNESLQRLLEQIGFMITKQEDSMIIQKVPKTSASTTLNDPSASMKRSFSGSLLTKNDLESLINTDAVQWAKAEDSEEATRRYDEYVRNIASFDIDAFNETIYKRVKDIEHIARKWQREARAYRDKAHRAQSEAHDCIALRSFKEGDLALFLPTRDQATKPWAAFNVGAPHYFLREQDSHRLGKRDWLIARISKVEERVVDLSKSMNGLKPLPDQRSLGEKSESAISIDDENPYELSDGLRWYLLDAAEEKPGAPINVGLGKVTVASANVDATGSSIRMKKSSGSNGATKTLTQSLDSRRSSTNSRKGLVAMASNSTSAPAVLDEMVVERTNSNDTPPIPSENHARPRSPLVQGSPSSLVQDNPPPAAHGRDQVGIINAPDW